MALAFKDGEYTYKGIEVKKGKGLQRQPRPAAGLNS
ncbi:hypothetical protein CCACVL1_07658 [Corchorus capsularis]|uniref:Uncharacterized protein n=1 Tax=Corchorus capsularis TaxID=210143 RepID=A0A1R3J4K1_COCAP|nr:hypothetical protein CCACVL1_07658 [Corchorus capsularis]